MAESARGAGGGTRSTPRVEEGPGSIGRLTPRNALRICFRREHLRRTVKIALIVGTLLTAINQLDIIVKGSADALTWVKCGLNYCVPFIVSNLGLLAGKRAEADREQVR
jgi:hypothetical protein